MKIRTDFVTNSSSSSYVVKITLESVQGKNYTVTIPPSCQEELQSHANVNCSVEAIAAADSIDTLIELLAYSVDFGCGNSMDDWCEEDSVGFGGENSTDDWEKEEVQRIIMNKMGRAVKRDLSEISQVKKITLQRAWTTYGEASSCFVANWSNWSEESLHLLELAKTICTAQGEEKEKAKAEMLVRLSNYKSEIEGAWQDKFPTGFMGTNESVILVWKTAADNIEEFAKMILEEQISNDDYAVETVEIDMQKDKVSSFAEYFLHGVYDDYTVDDNYDVEDNDCDGEPVENDMQEDEDSCINKTNLYPKKYTDEVAAEMRKMHKKANDDTFKFN